MLAVPAAKFPFDERRKSARFPVPQPHAARAAQGCALSWISYETARARGRRRRASGRSRFRTAPRACMRPLKPAAGRRNRPRPQVPRSRRHRYGMSRRPRHRQLRQLHLEPRPSDRAARRATCRSPATTRSRSTTILADGPTPSCCRRGPARPNEAGICLDLVAARRRRDPDLRRLPRPSGHRPGLWRRVVRAPEPDARQGLDDPAHAAEAVFRGINGPFEATRYHSLVVERENAARPISRSPPRARRPDHGRCRTRASRCTACSSIPRASCPSTASRSCSNFLDLAAAWNASDADAQRA